MLRILQSSAMKSQEPDTNGVLTVARMERRLCPLTLSRRADCAANEMGQLPRQGQGTLNGTPSRNMPACDGVFLRATLCCNTNFYYNRSRAAGEPSQKPQTRRYATTAPFATVEACKNLVTSIIAFRRNTINAINTSFHGQRPNWQTAVSAHVSRAGRIMSDESFGSTGATLGLHRSGRAS